MKNLSFLFVVILFLTTFRTANNRSNQLGSLVLTDRRLRGNSLTLLGLKQSW